MDFPIRDLMNEQRCHDKLLEILHPEGLRCPQCHAQDKLGVHDRHRDPVLDYQCGHCGRVFNLFTATVLAGTRRSVVDILLILRGVAQGVSTAQLARELGCSYSMLLQLRHRLQGLAKARSDEPRPALPDAAAEGDEMFQNAGEKGVPHLDPDDPPRRRANKRRGQGTFDNDRPAVAGVVGRQSGGLRLAVIDHADQPTLQAGVERNTDKEATIYTDESAGYARLAQTGRKHATVCHNPKQREWARDDDGDGIREVHDNTLEGIWTGLRNFLRTFRGVSKHYLAQYVAIFEWAYEFKVATDDALRILLGLRPALAAGP
jgi:transposase-like protein